MSTTATSAPVRERSAITDQRRLGAVSMSAFALVAGLTVWFVASAIHDGENTGTMIGILVASFGLVFFFPALKSYLLARRLV